MPESKQDILDSPVLRGVLLLVVFMVGVGGSAMGAYNIKRAINSPYVLDAKDLGSTLTSQAAGELSLADSDKDGLLDIDETKTYQTSPYLSDSDSDGFNDSEEIKNGTNPNCPEGQDCAGGETLKENTDNVASNASTTTQAAQLRSALLSQGMPAEQLQSISDEQLIQLYNQQLVQNQNATPPSNTSGNIGDMKQIRDLLKAQGLDEAVVNSLSDEQLQKILTDNFNSQANAP